MTEENLNRKYSGKDETYIIDRCKNGDIEAFKTIYNKHRSKMYNIALRLHGNREDAEDSIQEAFVQLFRKIKTFRKKSTFSTWFYRIVVNTCLNSIRKEKKRKKLDSLDDNVQKQIEYTSKRNPSLKVVLENEIKKLPSGYKAVFILYEIEGFTHKEISKILKISEGTSKSQLHFAKLCLRKGLKPYLENFRDEL